MQNRHSACIPFLISVIFLWGNMSNAVCLEGKISPQNMRHSCRRHTMPFEAVQCAFPHVSFQRSSIPLRKGNMFAQNQYFWHRASLSKVQYDWTCGHYQRMLFASYTIVLYGNTIFLWRNSMLSILGKLDDFPLTYVLFPLISPAFIHSGLKSNPHSKIFFQYYPTIMYSFNQISHSCQGDVAQNEAADSSRATMPFQKSAACIQYTILYIIPECVAKVSGFALEAWGLRRARSTLLLCPQPFASNCREGNIVVPMARSEKVVTLGGSKRRAASFRAAGAALCDTFQHVS